MASLCYDEESSTYYLSARQYDPATMQFLTKDPARADGEQSAYQYCGGDPVGKVDPSGLWAWTVFAYHYLTKTEAKRLNDPAQRVAAGSAIVNFGVLFITSTAGIVASGVLAALSIAQLFFPSFQYRKNDLISWSRSDQAFDAVQDGMCHWRTSHWFQLRARVVSNGAVHHEMVKAHQDAVNVTSKSAGKRISGDAKWRGPSKIPTY